MIVQELVRQLSNCSLHKEVVISTSVDEIHGKYDIHQIVETDKIYVRVKENNAKVTDKKKIVKKK